MIKSGDSMEDSLPEKQGHFRYMPDHFNGKPVICNHNASMTLQRSLLGMILMFCLGCNPDHRAPPAPVAGFGSTPVIDGVFGVGEWDDAEVVRAGDGKLFRVKHDRINLYFAFDYDGGNIYFDRKKRIQILHASAQLGTAEYSKSGKGRQALDKPFAWQLFGLQNEPPTEMKAKLAGFLAENGWVASTGPLGNMAQSEWAVSFKWLGIQQKSKRVVKTPSLYIFSVRMRLSPLEQEALLALPLEERRNVYPPLTWPGIPVPNDSLNNGLCPETISIDPSGWGIVRVDFN